MNSLFDIFRRVAQPEEPDTLQFMYRRRFINWPRLPEYPVPIYKGVCPQCGEVLAVVIAEDSHKITQRSPLTLSPSLVCPTNCGFHIVVIEGYADDCVVPKAADAPKRNRLRTSRELCV
jgi:hypothetical protein